MISLGVRTKFSIRNLYNLGENVPMPAALGLANDFPHGLFYQALPDIVFAFPLAR